jgi:hypothetical protein
MGVSSVRGATDFPQSVFCFLVSSQKLPKLVEFALKLLRMRFGRAFYSEQNVPRLSCVEGTQRYPHAEEYASGLDRRCRHQRR